MARTVGTYTSILKMAKQYGVDENALFVSAAKQYALQQRVLDNIKKALDEEDSLMTRKEYVKGRENVYANPLVRELPKHSDAANKTLAVMLDIIKNLGHPSVPRSKLDSIDD